MIKHLLIIAIIVCVASLFIFLPYSPGDYDSSSVIVSMYIQVVCFLGLVLVPIGIMWSIFEIRRYRRESGRFSHISYRFTRVALVILFVIFLLADFMLFMNNYLSLAIIILLLTCYFFFRALLFFKNLKNANQISLVPFPVYIICIPLLVFFIRFIFMATTRSPCFP